METQVNNIMTESKNTQTDLKIPCEVYSRVVGYLRPVQNWNKGKKQEFKDRRTFVVGQTTQQESK